MRLLFLFAFIILSNYQSFAQDFINISQTKTGTQGGVEICTFNGKPYTGFLIENFPNGKPKMWRSMKNGLADGQWQEWLETGELRYNAYWKEGKGHGLWQYFHDNGRLRYEESYLMDISNGISRSYFNNGQVEHDYFWLNGKKHGVWTSYNENGVRIKVELYEEDKLISTTQK